MKPGDHPEFFRFPAPPGRSRESTIRLDAGSSLHHQRVQTEAAGATHIGHTQVSQAAGSRYEASSIMLGADIARHALDVTLHEPDAHGFGVTSEEVDARDPCFPIEP